MDEIAIAVDIQNLTKRYSRKASKDSLNDISLKVPFGKICCILGPNGSGKTTLLKILAGLVQPTSGSISIMGIDPVKNPLEVKAKIGWMPAEERSGFYGRLTGRENLKFFAALQGIFGQNLERVMGNLSLQLGINDEIDKMILKTSAGAKQKVAFARTLLHNPSVLLLDEPMRGLDPHALLRFRRLLRDHLTRIQKKTILLSTHLLEEAKRVADMIVILQDGKILRTMDSKEIEKEFRNTTVEDFYLKNVEEVGDEK